MPNELHPEVKDSLNRECETRGFDHAMQEFDPIDWAPGVIPLDLDIAWNGLKAARELLKNTLRNYGVDPH